MKAAVFHAAHRPLELDEVPTPEPGPGEVLVRVAACGLCHTDLHYIDHGTPTFKPPPLILGHEISGTIAELGAGRHGLEGRATRCCCPRCSPAAPAPPAATGRENICEHSQMFGNHVDGGFAEFVVAPAKDVFRLPAGDPARGRLDHRRRHHHAVPRRGPPRPRRARRLGAGARLRRRRARTSCRSRRRSARG